jgi:hypothetical protein
MGADCGGATCAACFSFAATFLDTCNGVKLYQTQPLIFPLASGVDANKQALRAWDRAECAKGGKVAIACGDDSHYKSTDAGSIGARRMPTSYSCNMDEHLAAVTGWTNLFAISDSSAVVVGIDYHNAVQGRRSSWSAPTRSEPRRRLAASRGAGGGDGRWERPGPRSRTCLQCIVMGKRLDVRMSIIRSWVSHCRAYKIIITRPSGGFKSPYSITLYIAIRHYQQQAPQAKFGVATPPKS